MLSVAAPTLPAMAASPPDTVEPPAEWEGEPLDDPTDPSPSGEPEQPTASYRASGYTAAPTSVDRIAGPSRYETAAKAAQAGWPGGAASVVLASGEDFRDALPAAALAGAVGAPLLLTPPRALASVTSAELKRLAPETVYVAGHLGDEVVDALARDGYEVEVVAGADPYETSYLLAVRAVELGADASTVLVAAGEGFADALAAAALAAGRGHPLLLTPRTGGSAALRERVAELEARQVLAIGGRGVLPDEAVEGLPGLERVWGANRAATAAAVADHARARGLHGRPVLVGGATFADGLSGGVLAGVARRAPVLVTVGAELSVAVRDWLDRHGVNALTILGGRGSVPALSTCQLVTGQSRAFLCAEEELLAQGYNVGTVDGRVDRRTPWALYAFQKVAGLAVNGRFTEREWQAMLTRPRPPVRRPDLPADHVEIDIARQLILIVRGGEVAHAIHTSTGKPSTPTVRGTFTIYEKRNFRQSWNRMYRPVFFYRGYAIHGYPEIPLYPASHGCARVEDADMDFLWPLLRLGDRVATY